jgi:hypothetical protein
VAEPDLDRPVDVVEKAAVCFAAGSSPVSETSNEMVRNPARSSARRRSSRSKPRENRCRRSFGSELCRDERSILDRRINFVLDPAKRIDVEKNVVRGESGKSYEYDFLVIATGSHIAPEMIRGLAEGAHQFY